jgi:hypothetical protein
MLNQHAIDVSVVGASLLHMNTQSRAGVYEIARNSWADEAALEYSVYNMLALE